MDILNNLKVDGTITATGDITDGSSNKLSKKLDKLTTGPTAGTYTSVTINGEGQVTGGSNPTTLAGYGITDAVDLSSAQTVGGAKTWTGEQTIVDNWLIAKRSDADFTQASSSNIYVNGIGFRDRNDQETGAMFHYYETNGNASSWLSSRSKVSGSITDARIGVYVGSTGTKWATAPSRTYNASNTDDIVTIGTLNADISIAGDKTWTGVQTFNDLMIRAGSGINRAFYIKNNSMEIYNPPSNMVFNTIDFIDKNGSANNLTRLSEIATGYGANDNYIGITAMDGFNQTSGRAGIEVHYGSDNSQYALSSYRTYNSANTADIVTIGSLASNPNVVHTTGNETIAGNKNFTDNILVGSYDKIQPYSDASGKRLFLSATNSNNVEGRIELRMNEDGSVVLYLRRFAGGTPTDITIATIPA